MAKMKIVLLILGSILANTFSAPVDDPKEAVKSAGIESVEANEEVMVSKGDQVQIVNHIKGLLNNIVSQEEELTGIDRAEVLNEVSNNEINMEKEKAESVVEKVEDEKMKMEEVMKDEKKKVGEDVKDEKKERVEEEIKDEEKGEMKDEKNEKGEEAMEDKKKKVVADVKNEKKEKVGEEIKDKKKEDNEEDMKDEMAEVVDDAKVVVENIEGNDIENESVKDENEGVRQAVVTTTTTTTTTMTTTTTTRRTTTTTRRTTTTTEAPGILARLGNIVGGIGGNIGSSILTGTSYLAAAASPLWAPALLGRKKRDLKFPEGHSQLENEIMDFEAKILKHARNPQDQFILETIVHQVVEGIMNKHEFDQNDLAIKSQIISEVSVQLRRYERELEKMNQEKTSTTTITSDEATNKEFFPPTIISDIFKDIASLFSHF